MAAKVLPDSKVDQLLRQGLGPAAIARRLAEEDHIYVRPEAISVWKARRGRTTGPSKVHHELLPWTLRDRDKNKYPAKMLRLESRRRRGEELPPHLEAELKRWILKLREARAVVTYEPDVEPYWIYLQASPEELADGELIRRPSGE